MKKKDVDKLKELQEKFEERCSQVTNILKKLDKYENTGYFCADNFIIDGDVVLCEGDDYWQYGGHEHYCDYFESKFLYLEDSEIEKYVNNKIIEHEKSIKQKQEIEKLKKESEEKKLLEELKKKYE